MPKKAGLKKKKIILCIYVQRYVGDGETMEFGVRFDRPFRPIHLIRHPQTSREEFWVKWVEVNPPTMIFKVKKLFSMISKLPHSSRALVE